MRFEDNIRYKGDLLLVAYMDFETNAPTDNYFNPEQKRISYIIVFAFHPKLNFDHLVVQRIFKHSYKKLTTIDYLTNDQMECLNIKLVKQLKYCTNNVSQRKYKNAVAQMFCAENKFVADCLLSWFNKKFE